MTVQPAQRDRGSRSLRHPRRDPRHAESL